MLYEVITGVGEQRARAEQFAHRADAGEDEGEADAHAEAVHRRVERPVARGERLGASYNFV